MNAIGVIPARLGSTRLEEKVLKPIAGRPMIQHVWQRAKQARKLTDVIVACDDERIASCVRSFGGRAEITRADHPNGTSRVAEVAAKEDADVFINIQGDEPLIHPEGIDRLVGIFESAGDVKVATLAVQREDKTDYQNPNVVKVVCDQKGDALYFSRSPLPYDRENPDGPVRYLKHLGIYGYRKTFLLNFVGWKPTALETAEKLEQLRILENGYSIRVIETPYDSLSVDTREDLEMVEKTIQQTEVNNTTGVR